MNTDEIIADMEKRLAAFEHNTLTRLASIEEHVRGLETHFTKHVEYHHKGVIYGAPASAPTPTATSDKLTKFLAAMDAPGDDAVRALADALSTQVPFDTYPTEAVAIAEFIITKIRDGQVSGLWDDAAVQAEKTALYAAGFRDATVKVDAEIATLKAKLSEAERSAREWEQSACDYVDVANERDQARADLARADKAFSSLHDDHEKLKEDKALCECENREKQAAIEKFLEAEVANGKELARVAAERDNYKYVHDDYSRHADRAQKTLAATDLGKNYLHAALNQVDKLTAELAEAKARKFVVELPEGFYLDADYGLMRTYGSKGMLMMRGEVVKAIVAEGGEVKP